MFAFDAMVLVWFFATVLYVLSRDSDEWIVLVDKQTTKRQVNEFETVQQFSQSRQVLGLWYEQGWGRSCRVDCQLSLSGLPCRVHK